MVDMSNLKSPDPSTVGVSPQIDAQFVALEGYSVIDDEIHVNEVDVTTEVASITRMNSQPREHPTLTNPPDGDEAGTAQKGFIGMYSLKIVALYQSRKPRYRKAQSTP